MALLQERHPKQSSYRTLKHIRHNHHQLARLMALGVPQEEISLITGYSPAYISRIKSDPTFEALVDYYHNQRDEVFVDVVDRMKTLGLASIDELQRRLEDEPDEWSRRELMELTELMLVKPAAARTPMNTTVAVAPVSVSVNFIKSESHVPLPEPPAGPIIEHQPVNVGDSRLNIPNQSGDSRGAAARGAAARGAAARWDLGDRVNKSEENRALKERFDE
jgi:hypothetical protein